jgi:arylsulfatase A-like enzyme
MAELTKQPIPQNIDGISFLPLLRGDKQKKHDFLYFEFCKGDNQTIFSQAVRKGTWKAYRRANRSGGMSPLEIYNLTDDPFEEKDLAKDQPEIVKEMVAIIDKAHTPLAGQPKAGTVK